VLGERRRADSVPSFSRGRVVARDVLVKVAVRLRLEVAFGALLPPNADVVDAGLVHRDLAIRLRLVVAMSALVPLYADVVLAGLVPRDLVVRLRLVVAVGTLVPLNADVVLVALCTVMCLFVLALCSHPS